MTDPISPIGDPRDLRCVGARALDEDTSEETEASGDVGARLPVAIAPTQPVASSRPRRTSLIAFAAQLIGQGGQKRGLRGGPETLNKARSTYLETEWSGPADRRRGCGKITKTDI